MSTTYILALMALIMFFLARKTYPELVSFSKEGFLKFLKLLSISTFAKMAYLTIFPENMPSIEVFSDLSILDLLVVFWEDMFFVFPSLLLFRVTQNKILTGILVTGSALAFSSGHFYQGAFVGLLSLAYVPLMYHIGSRRGLLTVMVGHVLYDISVLYSLRLMEFFYGSV